MPTTKLKIALQRAIGFEHLGYGSFGVALERGLQELGVDTLVPIDIGGYKRPYPNVGAVVWAAQPGHAAGAWKGQFTACYTMWESTVLPDSFIANAHNFDMLIVPNELNLELFSKYNPNTFKVPLGFESGKWGWSPRELPSDTFQFLHCAAGAAEKSRKGTDLVLKAFELAFPEWQKMKPSPRLTVKCLKHPPEEREYLTIHQGQWPWGQLTSLYRLSHAMVIPSRGEGWGYHPIQAVATGMPVVLSDIPGHQEFMWADGFYPVSTKLVAAARFLQGNGGDWWEPNLDEIVEGMRDVYENYEKWLAAAKRGSWDVHNRFSELQMAQQVCDLIGAENMTVKETGEWETYEELRFATRVNRPLGQGECEVGGKAYILRPGEEYWIPANARQVLDEAGYLANPEEHRFRVE